MPKEEQLSIAESRARLEAAKKDHVRVLRASVQEASRNAFTLLPFDARISLELPVPDGTEALGLGLVHRELGSVFEKTVVVSRDGELYKISEIGRRRTKIPASLFSEDDWVEFGEDALKKIRELVNGVSR